MEYHTTNPIFFRALSFHLPCAPNYKQLPAMFKYNEMLDSILFKVGVVQIRLTAVYQNVVDYDGKATLIFFG